MPQQTIEFGGELHEFPADFTDADIAAALGTASQQQTTQAGPTSASPLDARMSKAFGYPVRTEGRVGEFATQARQHPFGTAVQLGAPAMLKGAGLAASIAKPAAQAAARGAGQVFTTASRHPFMLGLGGLGMGKLGGLAGIAAAPVAGAAGRFLSRLGGPAAQAVARTAAKTARPPMEGVQVERLFQSLARRPVLLPDEVKQFHQLERVVKQRAQHVGRGYASGGKRGLPK